MWEPLGVITIATATVVFSFGPVNRFFSEAVREAVRRASLEEPRRDVTRQQVPPRPGAERVS